MTPEPHAPSYWLDTGSPEPEGVGPVSGDRTVEVAVVGAGYTGLAAAHRLAGTHGLETVVLEAHRLGWGASGRNGGFASITLGKTGLAERIRRWGLEAARRSIRVGLEAVDTVRELIASERIDCAPQPAGALTVAHTPARAAELRERVALYRDRLGYDGATFLDRPALEAEGYLRGPSAHGAMRLRDGFGLHPMRYVRGLAAAARRRGAALCEASPVLAWRREGGWHHLATPGGTVRARRVVVGTNGYTREGLHPEARAARHPVDRHTPAALSAGRAPLLVPGGRVPGLRRHRSTLTTPHRPHPAASAKRELRMTDAPRLDFSSQEYARRLEAVRAGMRARGVAVMVVDQAEHLAYLTGFDRSATLYQACVIPLVEPPMMLLRRLDEPPFRERTWLTSHVAFADWDDPVAVLVGVLREHGWADGRIGLELDSHYLTVERYEAIRAALPRATLVNVAPALRELRLRKSPEELAYLRRAAQIADAAMRAAIGTAGPGVGERDVAAVAGRVFLDLGADHGRAGIVTSGARSGSLHGALGDRRLERGDILHLELVPQVRGYSARLMRPTVLGAPSAPQADAARRLVEIQDEQIEAMRVGAVAREVDRVCRAQVLGAQLRETFDNVTGYTLGYYSPWGPRSSDFTRAFTPSAGWVLEAGMVFHMYVSTHGMTFSETVLVTADGPERLTRLERRLFVR